MKINEQIESELNNILKQSNTNPRAGAIIVPGDKIISSGFAYKAAEQSSVGGKDPLLVHAEESALMQALKNGVNIDGADIYVLLVKDNDEIRYTEGSYCCVVCSRLLTQTGIKNIFYPTPAGWIKESVEEMFEKAIERAEETV